MTEAMVRQIIASYPEVELDSRSTDEIDIYSIDHKIMATIKKGSNPVMLDLRCDYNLGKLLRDKYESVAEPRGLNKRRFVTIILTGQLSDDEVRAQLRHAYEQTRALID